VTAHAQDYDDPESMWQAVHQLHARRIGHGLQLFQAKDLMRTIADRRIGIEMCPYAYYQIKGFRPMPSKANEVYQLRNYLQAGILVSVNTDNIGISAASISDNFLLLARMLPQIMRMEILQRIRNGVETAFWPAENKNH
jgi:adenosine deaminase